MSESRFLVTEAAQADLDGIQAYLQSESPRGAGIVGEAIWAALERLAEYPRIGHARPDLTDRPVLFWPVFSYLIVYNPDVRPIQVVRVLHASRDVRRVGL